ncbi:MAG: hypothetical protein JSR48_06180 [Verrucomicrobia bacterium]|nr:hypothetical protein [Verrucomicrobiota bacterium]
MKPLLLTWLAAALLCLAGCDYDVPITPEPTRPVDPRLVESWASYEPDEQKVELLNVRKLDDTHYVVSIDRDIYRAYHSDLGTLSFVSVQDLNSDDRKYAYYLWALSDDGRRLSLRRVRQELLPEKVKDPATIQRLLRENAASPRLFEAEQVFTRKTKG